MYQVTKGDRLYGLSDLGKRLYKIVYGVEPGAKGVEKKTLKPLHSAMRLLEKIMESYEDIDYLVLNEIGTTLLTDLQIPFGLNNEIELKDLGKVCQLWFKKEKETKKKPEYPDKTDYSHLTQNKVWYGGTESYTFNELENIALSKHARTPILECLVSDVLAGKLVDENFLPSRINWVVQSSAVDYLHLLLSSMQWLFEKFEIEGRFVISIHDEVRYLVPEKDAYKAGLILQIANMMVRAMFCHRLGMNSMPLDIAFFSGVDIDKVMRKEPTANCVTPSNPRGLLNGYGVPVGECLTINDLIAKVQ